jgi:hypothetical protein
MQGFILFNGGTEISIGLLFFNCGLKQQHGGVICKKERGAKFANYAA